VIGDDGEDALCVRVTSPVQLPTAVPATVIAQKDCEAAGMTPDAGETATEASPAAMFQVIGMDPVFERVIVLVADPPGRVENSRLDGLNPIPVSSDAPEQFSVMIGLSDASLYTVTVPVKEPVVEAVKVIGNMMLPADGTVAGSTNPVIKLPDELWTALMIVAVVPEFDNVIFNVLDVPLETAP
jgi:hypothetical protein